MVADEILDAQQTVIVESESLEQLFAWSELLIEAARVPAVAKSGTIKNGLIAGLRRIDALVDRQAVVDRRAPHALVALGGAQLEKRIGIGRGRDAVEQAAVFAQDVAFDADRKSVV